MLLAAPCVILLSWANRASAVPPFARRYDTSCQTCHTAFPQLTPFGEAFRRNGYHWPMGEDPDRSIDEPIALGHQVHEGMFPDEVWPGEIPGTIPVGFVITASGALARGGDGHGHSHGATPAVNTSGSMDGEWGASFRESELGLLLATPLGERVSVFAKLELSGSGDVNLERPHIVFSFFEEPYLMARVGAFEPTLYPFSIHRAPTGHNLAFTTVSLGDNTWAPEPQQIGLELFGTLAHRLGWAAGLVEGSGAGFDRDKDAYGRLEYKLGGMSLDGHEPTGYDRPWQELSAQIGASFYWGTGVIEDPTGGELDQSDELWRASADVTARFKDVRLTLAAFHQRHQRPIYQNRDEGFLTGALAEIDYVIWPWFIPVVRYELFRQDLPTEEVELGHRTLVGITALVRANISIRILGQARQDASQDFELEEVSLAVNAAF